MAALSLATDLGLGQPLEHELGVRLSALELADRLGCTPEEMSDVYDAMTHDRPHRRAMSPSDARAELGEMVGAGALEKRTVAAPLEAAGAAPLRTRQGHPA